MRRSAVALALLSLLPLGGAALALPFERDGFAPGAVETVQFGGRLNTDTFVPRGPGVGRTVPGRVVPGRAVPGRVIPRGGRGGAWGAAAVGVGAGLLLPHLIDGMRPRGPVVEEEYDVEEGPRRPRRQRAEGGQGQPPARPAQSPVPPSRLPPFSVPPASEKRLVADEVLIELKAGVDRQAVLERHRLSALGTARFDLAETDIIRARINDGRSARQVLRKMAADARVASAQPNYLYTLQQSPPPAVPAPGAEAPQKAAVSEANPPVPAPQARPQYVLDKLGVLTAHGLARGERVKVAMVDTGVDENHPELAGAVANRFDALDGAAQDVREHGTAMAGAIVARASLRGLAPRAELLAARAFGGDAQATGTSFQIIQSLDWAAAQGARVFSLSFAGPRDRLLGKTLEGAEKRKIVAVAAMGNAGPNTPALYPAAEAAVVAITATDATDAVFKRANTGRHVAFSAPGVDVIAAAPEGRYVYSSGTSIATAHVSSLVALMLERNPDLDAAGVRRILAATAVDLGPKGPDPIYGAGRVDAAAAVQRAAEEAGKR